MKITIILNSCHDYTTISDIEVTEEQLELLKHIVKCSEEDSEYRCQPTMELILDETRET